MTIVEYAIMLALIAIAVALAAQNVQAAGRGCFRPSYYSNQLFVIFLRKRSKRMKRRKLFLGSLFCCAWLTTDLPPRTSPPSKLDSEPFEVHSKG